MKTSELQKIIREEIQSLNEGNIAINTKHRYWYGVDSPEKQSDKFLVANKGVDKKKIENKDLQIWITKFVKDNKLKDAWDYNWIAMFCYSMKYTNKYKNVDLGKMDEWARKNH